MGYKAIKNISKYLNKTNKHMSTAIQFLIYAKLDRETRKMLVRTGAHSLTKEQYRRFDNLLSTTLYRFNSKNLIEHMKKHKLKAFTKENWDELKDSISAYSKARGKLAVSRDFDKLYGLGKYREFKGLTLSKKATRLATTFGNEFAGNKYKATKKTFQSLPNWKNPMSAYKDAWNAFKESNKELNNLGKGVKVLGKGLGPISLGVITADNYSTYKGDTQKVVVGTAVDTVFSSGATAAGAAVGSAFFPPLGTVVGAGAGMVLSSATNKKFGTPPRSITERTKNIVNKGVDSVQEIGKNIGKSITGWFK